MSAALTLNVPVPVPRYAITKHDRVQIRGVHYRGDEFTEKGFVFRRADDTSLAESFSHDEVDRLLGGGQLKVDVDWFKGGDALARLNAGEARLSQLSKEIRALVIWRQRVCDEFLKLEHAGKASRSGESINRVMPTIMAAVNEIYIRAQVGDKKQQVGTVITLRLPPSPTKLRDLLRKYASANYNPIALLDGRSGCGNLTPRFPAPVIMLMTAAVMDYMSSGKPTKAALYRKFEAQINELNANTHGPALPLPTQRTFETWVDRLDPWSVLVAREGQKAAEAKMGIVTDGLDVSRPLERVEIDEWKLPLMALLIGFGIWETMTEKQRDAVKRARPWATVAICVATRCIVALRVHVAAPSAATAISTLEMIMMDKTALARAAGAECTWEFCGRPYTLAMDSGAAFVADAMQAAIADCRIGAIYPPSGMASLRARIERLFRTLGLDVFSFLPGRTFESIEEKGDYDPSANAAFTVEEIAAILIRHVVDIYHNRPHWGLAGETPRNAWKRLTAKFGVRPPLDAEERRHVFGICVPRVIGDQGVRIAGLHYQSPQLQQAKRTAKNQTVLVRVDRMDLGAVSVLTPEGLWITVEYCRRGIDTRGLTLAEWLTAATDLLRRNADVSKLSQGAVDRAILAVKAKGDFAAERAGLGSPIISAEMLDRADKKFLKAFAFADRGDGEPIDLFGDEDSQGNDDSQDFLGNEADPFGLTTHVVEPEKTTEPDIATVVVSPATIPATPGNTTTRNYVDLDVGDWITE